MSLSKTVVGIDPSGRRLAVAAVRAGLGGPSPCAPPAVFELRGDRGPDEAEGVLGEYVARNGLAGSAARLCVPADRVHTARVSFPPLKDRDLRAAIGLELERLFPFPPSTLRFAWRRLEDGAPNKAVTLVVAAAPAAYVERWEEIASRSGLRLTGAVPCGWSLSAAWAFLGAARGSEAGHAVAILRDAGSAVECTILSGGVPFFSASRPCPQDAMPAEGLSLLREGLMDGPTDLADGAADLAAPSGWYREEPEGRAAGAGLRRVEEFESRAAKALAGPGGGAGDVPTAWGALGAFGAAADEKGIDLLSPAGEGAAPRLARAAVGLLSAAVLVLALAWPATVAWKTRAELRRVDSEIAALRPLVSEVEVSLGELAEVQAKISLLFQAHEGRGEALDILRELTDRLPQGTWLTTLRIEERKVEMDGLSPSASEIFPLLTRDGRFRGVEFASPITRQPDNLERFRIRADYVPAGREEAR